ncbi:MAG: type II toxin-antitoxin system VapC family toxin [Caldilineaceae bacterium SB0664_bin_27]|uniref:Type II toxin-antitoxin system VapC family toxin n=1 Tax=Caldilineaceae bacterium SB0664_bin_27 TaxID=2605260 RepID=A0A6B0YXX2_9CHLR|nr:type II toxin-antitoxin system VapC family toxin [Caldilineaceae bacterium SB0664_bin_27]
MILLDTHVLIWQELGDLRLGPQARRVIASALQEDRAAVSAISFWEVGMRVQNGRLGLFFDLGVWRRDLLDRGLIEIPIDGDIATRAGLLPNMHGDPADRIIVATALEGHQLVTADGKILRWPGQLGRLDARD